MEAAVTSPPESEAPETAVETSPAEHRDPGTLFHYSEWVHLGPGSDTCEHAEDGTCPDPLHFHAWCRLPNQFQHQSIKDKAQAAKARRVRLYRDPESDASAILDSQLEEVEYTVGEEAARNTYVEELVYKDFMRDYFNVVQELAEEEPEADGEPKKWETIEEDKERLQVLQRLAPEERPEEEYAELETRVQAYGDEVEARVRAVQEPVRQSLADRPMEELRMMVREERIQKEANAIYMQTYALWEQYIGTLKTQVPKKINAPQERVFDDVNHLKAAAPEIVAALEQVFVDLDGEFGKTLNPTLAGKG